MRYLLALLLVWTSLLARQTDFAALIIDGEEKEFIFYYKKDQEYYIDVEALAYIPDITIDQEHDKIITPIGDAVLSDILNEAEDVYIPLSQLDKVLRIKGNYLEKEVAFYLLTPWRHLHGRGQKREKKIDIYPPSNTLTGVRLEADGTYQNGTFTNREELQVSGRIMDGITKLSTLRVNEETPYINELYWLKSEKRYTILAGLQNSQPHQLLPYTQMTGVQAIWANYDLPDISNYQDATLRPSLGADNRIIQGKGPVGGSVVLMVNNKPRIARRIRLDGTYRIDIGQENLAGSDLVELWIYERDPVGSPTMRQNLNYIRQASILEKGQFSILGGAGEGGNLFNPYNQDTNGSMVANLYLRYGLTEKVTLEGGLMQDAFGRDYTLAGVTSAVTDDIVVHAALSTQEGLLAMYATVEGRWEKDWLTLRWQSEPEGYRGNLSDKRDGYFDYVKTINDQLSLGLNAQYHLNETTDVKFALPTLRYRPINELSLTIIPNYDGYYRYSATYIPNPDLRFNYIYEEQRHTLSIVDYITDEWNLYFDGSIDSKTDRDRYELGAAWRSAEYNDLYFQAGAIYNDNEVGARINIRHVIVPGIYAQYEARYEPYLTDKSKTYVYVNLITDFGFAEGKVIPTRAPQGQRNMRGYIAGSVYINGTKQHIDAEDIQLLLNNVEVKAGVNAKGRFFIENLKAGIYTVKLDPASLPMEYTPVQSSYNVKVANGAVSTVDFYVDVFYGIAGKLHRKQAAEPVEIVLRSAKDDKEYTTYTDRFDYYRIDGIPPGEYRLTVRDDRVKATPRKVIVKDDFLFDQDLYVQ